MAHVSPHDCSHWLGENREEVATWPVGTCAIVQHNVSGMVVLHADNALEYCEKLYDEEAMFECFIRSCTQNEPDTTITDTAEAQFTKLLGRVDMPETYVGKWLLLSRYVPGYLILQDDACARQRRVNGGARH